MGFGIWGERRPGVADRGAEMRFGVLGQVRAYWEGLRRGADLPQREAIDPRGIAGALDCVFMAERIGTGLARFRIAGMRINEVAGTEVRGLPLSVLLTAPARLRFATALERVFTAPAVADIAVEAERGLGRPAMEGRLLLLPLVSANGATDLCLGCFALEGEVGRVPRRFSVTRAVEEVLAVSQAKPMAHLREAYELAEPPAAERPRGPRPALRLIRPDE